jgi:hypothetical protein
MATPDVGIFDNRPFRAVLACAVRGVRRVAPLIDQSQSAALLRQRLVSFSHFFAAGSIIEPVQLDEILYTLEAESSSKPISRSAVLARSAIENLARSTALAAHILVVADRSPSSVEKTVKEKPTAAYDAAKSAFISARDAIGARSNPRKRAGGISSDEFEIGAAAFGKDLLTLATVPFESEDWPEDWLGVPFDAGEDGEFGELWPRGIVPKWYGIARQRLNIISANDLNIEQWNGLERPDVICWQLSGPNKTNLEAMKSRIATINRDYAARNTVPPLFVIFADGIDDRIAHDLISEGATVFRNELGRQAPANSRELVEATAAMMGGAGVHLRDDFSQYAQQPTASSSGIFRQGITWRPNEEITRSADRYSDIVDLSQPLTDRKKTESGWPIDI